MRRPPVITAIGWLFVAAGLFGVGAALRPFVAAALGGWAMPGGHGALDPVYAGTSGILAILGGLFVMRGANWARWLLVAWMAGHIVLGALHSPLRLIVHAVVFTLIAFGLYRREAGRYFGPRGGGAGTGEAVSP